ncbi:hypothetical protein MP228_010701 [Amoeboaphelidium protococcarum]|nr:hypothetical protein MP228_010701 [Amoeboaphelidium protococcarum]
MPAITYDIDLKSIRQQYYRLQQKCHPDTYAKIGNQQQDEYARQWSAYVNTAYKVLQDPLKRSQYILRILNLVDQDGDNEEESQSQSRLPDMNEFLIQMMEYREELEEQGASQELVQQIKQDQQELIDQLQSEFAKLLSLDQVSPHYSQTIFILNTKLKYYQSLLESTRQ